LQAQGDRLAAENGTLEKLLQQERARSAELQSALNSATKSRADAEGRAEALSASLDDAVIRLGLAEEDKERRDAEYSSLLKKCVRRGRTGDRVGPVGREGGTAGLLRAGICPLLAPSAVLCTVLLWLVTASNSNPPPLSRFPPPIPPPFPSPAQARAPRGTGPQAPRSCCHVSSAPACSGGSLLGRCSPRGRRRDCPGAGPRPSPRCCFHRCPTRRRRRCRCVAAAPAPAAPLPPPLPSASATSAAVLPPSLPSCCYCRCRPAFRCGRGRQQAALLLAARAPPPQAQKVTATEAGGASVNLGLHPDLGREAPRAACLPAHTHAPAPLPSFRTLLLLLVLGEARAPDSQAPTHAHREQRQAAAAAAAENGLQLRARVRVHTRSASPLQLPRARVVNPQRASEACTAARPRLLAGVHRCN
jgi:hypothetical protein